MAEADAPGAPGTADRLRPEPGDEADRRAGRDGAAKPPTSCSRQSVPGGGTPDVRRYRTWARRIPAGAGPGSGADVQGDLWFAAGRIAGGYEGQGGRPCARARRCPPA